MADYKHADLNRFEGIMRLTRDSELKFTATGTAFLKSGLVYSKKFKTKAGEERNEVMFLDATVWGQSAEFLTEYMKKGRAILIEGSLRQNNWETDDGEKRSKIEINASRIQTLTWDGEYVDAKIDAGEEEDEDEPQGGEELPF